MFIKWIKHKNSIKIIKVVKLRMYKSCKNRYITNQHSQ